LIRSSPELGILLTVDWTDVVLFEGCAIDIIELAGNPRSSNTVAIVQRFKKAILVTFCHLQV
jgi:hypothetical protein